MKTKSLYERAILILISFGCLRKRKQVNIEIIMYILMAIIGGVPGVFYAPNNKAEVLLFLKRSESIGQSDYLARDRRNYCHSGHGENRKQPEILRAQVACLSNCC